jgi:hypothetical protein
MGIWMTSALVVGNIIGAGLFLLPSALAPYGPASQRPNASRARRHRSSNSIERLHSET